jgi:DNA-binding transcriptional LysR family regulator
MKKMELRHLRYFVAVAEERSFVRAATRLRVAQPALSKQIRDLESELEVTLFQRLPRGVRLTRAGEAFLVEARSTLDSAARAVASARAVAEHRLDKLQFAHGELASYSSMVEDLLAAFREAHPDVQLCVSSQSDAETYDALQQRRIDVGCVFLAEWPLDGFAAHRLVDCRTTGVLLPAHHPLAARPAVRLQELRTLSWLHSGPQRWPGFIRTYERALRERGLEPAQRRERPRETPTANMLIAAGEAWTLASEAFGAPYRAGSTAIVYRPFLEPPIPCWIALVWHPDAAPLAHRLVDVARRAHLEVRDADPAARAG